jgi:hypothetical protein
VDSNILLESKLKPFYFLVIIASNAFGIINNLFIWNNITVITVYLVLTITYDLFLVKIGSTFRINNRKINYKYQ